MSKEKGSLSIHSENIFPIIKKWLYSEHDIFARELISNASDAITKLRKLNSLGEANISEDNVYKIDVVVDEKNKTLTFIDNGLGMTEEEIKKYINQIAFSGAEDFLDQYKDKTNDDQIIGHFGLGFYSAFMVAEKVEINTKSYKDAPAVKWICQGGTEFEMEEGTRAERGTEIILYISEDGTEFLSEYKMRSTIEKYCSFMPYDIFLTDANKEEVVKDESTENAEEEKAEKQEPKPLNTTTPLYVKKPNECTDEEYKEFYRKTFMDFKEPLFWIHLNMDYPFNLKGILYFPRFNHEFDNTEGQIKLYNNQVFVADNIKEVIPEFLLLLKGVIDCPDLPLNVSRSFLQNDGFVKKISTYISKKVGDKLNTLYNTERTLYEGFWGDINPFIKFGCLKDETFYDKVKAIMLYKTTTGNHVVLSEYLENNKAKHENKVYYVTDEKQQAQYIKMFKDHDMEAVILEHNIDQPYISHLEMKETDVKFVRVDSDLTDTMKDTSEIVNEDEDKTTLETLEKVFKESLGNDNLKVKIETLKSEEITAVILLSEDSRRMQEMSKMYGMYGMDASMFKTEETLLLNKKNELVKYIVAHQADDTKKEDLKMFCEQIYDLAMLSHKSLSPDAMTTFISRSHAILKKLI